MLGSTYEVMRHRSGMIGRGGRAISAAFVLAATMFAATLGCGPAHAAIADEPTAPGPYTPKSEDYKIGATVDPLVTKGSRDANGAEVKTELWARVWYPTKGPELKNAPIVVFLHGEHGTCGRMDGKWRIDDRADYSFSGTCPAGYEPTPNHWGYDYVASRLATQGYVTISINTNRGINQLAPDDSVDPDPALIIRRGRMILRHLMQFGRWETFTDLAPQWFSAIRGKMDWTKVSLVGHSRGGDAIVNAYYQFKGDTDGWKSRLPSNMKIVAVAAIAPTDFAVQKSDPNDPLPLKGVGYGVLLPMCDGDVIRLSGIRHYDRAVGFFPDLKGNFKAVFATNGANHNGYNTEWHTQDRFDFATSKPTLQDCPGQKKLFPTIGVSPDQQELGRYFVMSLIRAKTKDGSWAETLNPAFDLPKPIQSYKIDRSWFPGTPLNGARLLKRFIRSQPSVDCGSETIFPYGGVSTTCTPVPEHVFNASNLADLTNVWAARVRWGKPANSKKPENKGYWAYINLRGAETDFKPVDLGKSSKLKTLDIRLAPDCELVVTQNNFACERVSKQAPDEKGSQNIVIQLVDDKQKYSNRHFVYVKDHTEERQAVGIEQKDLAVPANPLYHALLSSVRIPLSEFEKDADRGFNMAKISAILIKFSADGLKGDNKSGGLFVGDVWATTEAVTSMNFRESADATAANDAGETPPPPPSLAETAAAGAASPLPAAGFAPAYAPELADAPAAVGSRIVDAVRTTLPAAGMPVSLGLAPVGDVPVVQLTLVARGPLIEAASGFNVSVGGRLVEAAVTGRDARETTLAVPAALVDDAPDGAAVAVLSGGSTWTFGPLNKASIR